MSQTAEPAVSLEAFRQECMAVSASILRQAALAYEYVERVLSIEPGKESRRRATAALAEELYAHGYQSGSTSKDAAIKILINRANAMIRTHALICQWGGIAGRLTYTQRKYLAPLMLRTERDGVDVWNVWPGIETDAESLVMYVATENPDRYDIKRRVAALRAIAWKKRVDADGQREKSKSHADYMNRRQAPWRARKWEEKTTQKTKTEKGAHPLDALVNAGVRDAATSLSLAIARHPDVESLVRHLLRELSGFSSLSEPLRAGLIAALETTSKRRVTPV